MQCEDAGAMMMLVLPFPTMGGRGEVEPIGLQISPPSSCQPCRIGPERGRIQGHHRNV